MKVPRLVLIFAIAVCTAAQSPDPQCKIEGHVVSAATGAPLKNATLRALVTGRVPPGHSVNGPDEFETASDAEGQFVFDAIPHAEYSLKAERNGYLSYDHEPVLDCAQENKNVIVKLTPQGLISGRVVDDDGEPVPAAEVEVMRRIYVNGSRKLHQVDLESTHADGSFAIGGLKPGRYYVRASHRKEEDRPAESGRKVSIKEAFVPTFFPAAPDIASATPIDVAAGAQVPGIDIRLKKSRAFRVSGKVVYPKGALPLLNQTELNLTQPDGPPAVPSAEIENGRFEFRDILPGAYVLRPEIGTSGGSTAITVRDEDVSDVALTLGAPVELKVTVTTEGPDIWQPQRSQFTFIFLPESGRSPEMAWATNQEGKFIAELAPGRYRLMVFPPLGYLKSIRLGGQDVAADKIDLALPSALDIVVSMNSAQIDAVARDADGQIVPKAAIQACDSRDSCAVLVGQSLAPGEYSVCAWADDGDGIITVPEFRALFESQCAKIKLEEKSHENIELKLITKPAMEAEAAKIP